MNMEFSRRLAVCLGTITPALEIVRRWHQLSDPTLLWVWFDDVLLGVFLLYGAWSAGRDRVGGRPILAAAWGFMCGLVYGSFFSQLMELDRPDPSGVPAAFAVAVKGIGFGLAILGLVSAVRRVDGAAVEPHSMAR